MWVGKLLLLLTLLVAGTAVADETYRVSVGGHDIIACPTKDGKMCIVGDHKTITAQQFAKNSGYKTVYKTYVLLNTTGELDDMIIQVDGHNPVITTQVMDPSPPPPTTTALQYSISDVIALCSISTLIGLFLGIIVRFKWR